MSRRGWISKQLITAVGVAIALTLPLGNDFAAAPQSPGTASASAATDEWLTWGYDQERTLWNRGETVLNKNNVSQLTLKWKTQIPTPATEVVLATLTTPLVARVNLPQGPVSRVFVVGGDNTV